MIVAHRSGADVAKLADCVAPALLVAQGIGRFGNWWNQELFGEPTNLPWGLEIDPENRPIQYIESDTFHPTFLYEALWCFAAAGLLLIVERVFRLRPGNLFAVYVFVYSIGRIWIEWLRIDPSHEIAGVRLNVWVAIVFAIGAAAVFVWRQRNWRRGPAPPARPETMAVPRSRARP
jgi:prolipoprotein diacylglyceryl transferase